MFVGRSPEELELAGEESSSGSWFDKLKEAVSPVVSQVVAPLMPGAKKVLEVVQSPAGKAAGAYFFPQATLAMNLAQGLKGAAQGQSQSPPPPKGKTEAGHWVRRRRGSGSVMGAAPPMSQQEVIAMIKREPHPVKRERMLVNYMRSLGR